MSGIGDSLFIRSGLGRGAGGFSGLGDVLGVRAGSGEGEGFDGGAGWGALDWKFGSVRGVVDMRRGQGFED